MAKKKKKSKRECSKILLFYTGAMALLVTLSSPFMSILGVDATVIVCLITSWFTVFGVAVGFYYNKAKAENKIKLRQIYGPEAAAEAYNGTEYIT